MENPFPPIRKRWGFWRGIPKEGSSPLGGEHEMAYFIETKRKKSGKRYYYLVEAHREGKTVVKRRVEKIGSVDRGSPPISEILGEPVVQALILMWKEKGSPRLPITAGITIGQLDKYLYTSGGLLTQEALDIILKGGE
jgi:hypothetical protein